MTVQTGIENPRCSYVFPDKTQCIYFADHVQYAWSKAHVKPGATIPENPGLKGQGKK